MNMHVQASHQDAIAAIKSRQQRAWESGDYAIVGTTLQIVGETLCEAVDLRAGQKVLDVAAGNGNATLAAARRFAGVTSTDYVGALLDRARDRAQAERLPVTFREADAEALPFADQSFDVVLSTFGVMFTPDQRQAAHELVRVCRKGGKIGLANWTPDGFIGKLFRLIGQYVPPAPGMKSSAMWGSRPHLETLFGETVTIETCVKTFCFRYKSPQHWIEVFTSFYGPLLKTFEALDDRQRGALARDLLALIEAFNAAKDGTAVIPSEYLEVVLTRHG